MAPSEFHERWRLISDKAQAHRGRRERAANHSSGQGREVGRRIKAECLKGRSEDHFKLTIYMVLFTKLYMKLER